MTQSASDIISVSSVHTDTSSESMPVSPPSSPASFPRRRAGPAGGLLAGVPLAACSTTRALQPMRRRVVACTTHPVGLRPCQMPTYRVSPWTLVHGRFARGGAQRGGGSVGCDLGQAPITTAHRSPASRSIETTPGGLRAVAAQACGPLRHFPGQTSLGRRMGVDQAPVASSTLNGRSQRPEQHEIGAAVAPARECQSRLL